VFTKETDNRRSCPRKGQLDDKAHPPIHPVKFPADYNQLEPNEKRVYELLVRRFLACVSVDAKGQETVACIEQGDEKFNTKGLIIDDIGYLEVYTYEKWNANHIPDLRSGEDFIPSEINLKTGSTSAPNFLTESELITLMDKNGIGTDATIHEHIKTIQDRCYATFTGGFFKPTLIGTCLIKTYEAIGIEIYKPYLRAQMEKDMKNVCDGRLRKV
jgi:DNA topoisomerase-3